MNFVAIYAGYTSLVCFDNFLLVFVGFCHVFLSKFTRLFA